jgi:hypothetical protein
MNDIKKVLEILEKNQVRLEFESPENFVKTVEELKEYLLNEKLDEIFYSTCDGVLYEFDISHKKLISSGVFYPLSTKDFTPYKQVPFHLDVISKIFSFYERNLLNLYDTYCVMYKEQDLTKPAAFYYTIEKEVFFDIDPNSWKTMFSYLNLNEKNTEFLANETDNLFLRYIGFNKENQIDKLGFHTLYEYFCVREPLNFYSNYKKFEQVFYTIKEIARQELISLQYSSIKSDYFGVEIALEREEVKPAMKKLYDATILTDEQYNNIVEMNISEDYSNSVLKFRWENENTFDIKFYLQKQP